MSSSTAREWGRSGPSERPLLTSLPTLLFLVLCACATSDRPAPPPQVYRHYPEQDFRFSRLEWSVRGGPELQGAGPNYWGGAPRHVDLDPERDEVTLRVEPDRHGTWRSAEISAWIPPDTSRIEIDFRGLPERLDPHIVLGVFVYRNDHSEYDLEFSSWGQTAKDYPPVQFVVAPPIVEGHIHRFRTAHRPDPMETIWTQRFEWEDEALTFTLEQDGERVATWRYEGEDVPQYEDHRLHINLWLFEGRAPMDRRPVEVTITRVTFCSCSSSRKRH